MYLFHSLGTIFIRFLGSIRLFFTFLGHLFTAAMQLLSGKLSPRWLTTANTLFLSGVRLVLPILILSALIGLSLSLSFYEILSRFQMQKNALVITQNIVIRSLVPILIGFILSIQTALNLINVPTEKLQKSTAQIMQIYIIPMLPGILLTGLLLYVYALFAALISVYSTFHFILNVSTHDYLLHITSNLSLTDLGHSLLKILLYCLIVAAVTSYYYYEISIRTVSLRKAVSSIMTRSILWIIIASAYLGIYSL